MPHNFDMTRVLPVWTLSAWLLYPSNSPNCVSPLLPQAVLTSHVHAPSSVQASCSVEVMHRSCLRSALTHLQPGAALCTHVCVFVCSHVFVSTGRPCGTSVSVSMPYEILGIFAKKTFSRFIGNMHAGPVLLESGPQLCAPAHSSVFSPLTLLVVSGPILRFTTLGVLYPAHCSLYSPASCTFLARAVVS